MRRTRFVIENPVAAARGLVPHLYAGGVKIGPQDGYTGPVEGIVAGAVVLAGIAEKLTRRQVVVDITDAREPVVEFL